MHPFDDGINNRRWDLYDNVKDSGKIGRDEETGFYFCIIFEH